MSHCQQNQPLIAVTMGDPAGIGPEIIVKALCDPEVTQRARCVVTGSADILQQTVEELGCRAVVRKIRQPQEADTLPGIIHVIEPDHFVLEDFTAGQISAGCGRASFAYIQKAVYLALSGQVKAVATAPINKEALRAGQIPYIGHTEILAGLTGTQDPLTMFETQGLRVFFLTRHLSLRQACDMVTKERIVLCARRSFAALEQMGIRQGVLAVAGLNPHSGEHGLFGAEEVEEIAPAVEQLRREGYPVEGPIGADSVFHLAKRGRYAAVLSLYHDQGHIATKTLDFERTISITCGLPFLRTSVDHGTAMDIAGKGTASPVSMKEAILLAARYSFRLSD